MLKQSESITIADLLKTHDIRTHFNNMDFNHFVKMVEHHKGVKFSDGVMQDFKFMGLNNIDFLVWVESGEHEKI